MHRCWLVVLQTMVYFPNSPTNPSAHLRTRPEPGSPVRPWEWGRRLRDLAQLCYERGTQAGDVLFVFLIGFDTRKIVETAPWFCTESTDSTWRHLAHFHNDFNHSSIQSVSQKYSLIDSMKRHNNRYSIRHSESTFKIFVRNDAI